VLVQRRAPADRQDARAVRRRVGRPGVAQATNPTASATNPQPTPRASTARGA
jgi:hypothetical protein